MQDEQPTIEGDAPTLEYGLVIMLDRNGGFGMQPLPNAVRVPNEYQAIGLLAMASASLQAKLTAANTLALREQQQAAKQMVGALGNIRGAN